MHPPAPSPPLPRYEDNDMRQINALNKRLESLTIADMSPRLALQARHNSVINTPISSYYGQLFEDIYN